MVVTQLIHPHCPVCEELHDDGVADTTGSLVAECGACGTDFTMYHNGTEWIVDAHSDPTPHVYALIEIPPQKESTYIMVRRRPIDIELEVSQYGLIEPTYRQAISKDGLLAWLREDVVDIVSRSNPDSPATIAGWDIGCQDIPMKEIDVEGESALEVDVVDYVERQETVRASIHELFEHVKTFFEQCEAYDHATLMHETHQILRQWLFLTESPSNLLMVARHLAEEPLDDIAIVPYPDHADGLACTVQFTCGDQPYPILFSGLEKEAYDQLAYIALNGLLYCCKDKP